MRFAISWLGGFAVLAFLRNGRLGGRSFVKVLHDQGDAAVGGIERGVPFAEPLIGKAADLGDLIKADALGLHEAAGGVGAIRGKLPVGVGSALGVGLGVGVPFDGDFVG